MVFSSALFIFGFAPIFLFCYFLVPERGRNSVILVASIIFYAVGAGTVALVLAGSVWLNQFVARRLAVSDGKHNARLLAMGVGLNLAALMYYKYTAFGWNIVANLFQDLANVSFGSAPQIVLPIGISFFTFQGISYIIDVHRGRVLPAPGYFDFAVYHTLFPQLVAGPIVRYIEIQDRLYRRSIDLGRLTEGAYRFCLGVGKKIVIADNLGNLADQIIKLPSHELTCGHAWLGIFCYSFQIYYDFSGYSDMAIGLGKLLGFDFPENFDQPYCSANITEFWRRWHMTLSRWFRDYVYIPLGGNRGGPLRTYFNLAVVFVLCGLWHGAGLNFLIWGMYHGALLVIERLLDRHLHWRPRGPLAVAVTFALVMIGWVFFRIDDLGAAFTYLRAMFFAGTADIIYFPVGYFLTGDTVTYLAIATLFAFLPIGNLAALRPDRLGLFSGQLCFGIFSFAVSLVQLASNSFNPFIYFRF